MFGRFWKRTELRLSVLIVVEQDGEGYYAYAPALKGLHVDGSTEEEAFENAKLATRVYLESLARHGDPLPVGPGLAVREESHMEIPEGALPHEVIVQWPSLRMSGAS